MSTPIRPEISKKNKYAISRERYYELAHFCRQYHELMRKYSELSRPGIKASAPSDVIVTSSDLKMMTEDLAISSASILERIQLIDEALSAVDSYIREAMKICVTMGISFDKINAKQQIPICRDYFYINYRKFFWVLDKLRS